MLKMHGSVFLVTLLILEIVLLFIGKLLQARMLHYKAILIPVHYMLQR